MGAVSMDAIKELRAKTAAGISLCKEAIEASDNDMQKAIEYINSRSDVVSRLHNMTGAKIGLCKIALNDADNDFEGALKLIKERGWEDEIAKSGEKAVKEGIIEAYVHGADKKLVALAEITCLTDFVARNDNLRNFAHEVAMQIAAMGAKYISRESIPADILDAQKDLFKKEALAEGKPENILDKIVDGKLNKYYEENCLLDQKWIKDDTRTMKELLDELINKTGEPVEIRRILLWKLGD